MNICPRLLACLAAASFAGPAVAEGVYLATGPFGEASFSDFAAPDAVTIDIDVHQPSSTEADAARRRVAETMAIAAELEDARLARESDYAERRAEAARRAASKPQTYEVPRFDEPEYGRVVGSSYFRDHSKRRHHRGPRAPEPPEPAQPPSPGKSLKWPSRRSGR